MPAARTFTVGGAGLTTVAAVVTLVWINPPAAPGVSFEILRVWVGQVGGSATGQQRVQLSTQVTAFPTVTSVTPWAHNRGDPTVSLIAGGTTGAAGTCGINASVEGAGTKTPGIQSSFHLSNGWEWVPTDHEQIVLVSGQAHGLGLYLPVAPVLNTGWQCGITYKES